MKIITNENICTKQLTEFFQTIDQWFNPFLSQLHKLDKYADKVLSDARVVAVLDEHRYVACYVAYCNPKQYNEAKLVLLATLERGLGSLLIHNLIDFCVNCGMMGIITQTWETNLSAIAFYQKHGFVEIERVNNRINCIEKSIVMRLDLSANQ